MSTASTRTHSAVAQHCKTTKSRVWRKGLVGPPRLALECDYHVGHCSSEEVLIIDLSLKTASLPSMP